MSEQGQRRRLAARRRPATSSSTSRGSKPQGIHFALRLPPTLVWLDLNVALAQHLVHTQERLLAIFCPTRSQGRAGLFMKMRRHSCRVLLLFAPRLVRALGVSMRLTLADWVAGSACSA